MLATLALHDGQVVSTDRLVDVVWGEAAPPTAVNTLQSHVSYLRGVLGSKAAILARPPGYLLDLGGDGTDVQAGRAAAAAGQRSRPIRPRARGTCGRRWRCGAGGRWPTWPGWPGWRSRRGRLDLLRRAGQAGAVRGAGWRPGSMRSSCPTWNRWWPSTRWMSRSTASSCWRCTGAAGRPMRWRPISRLRRALDEELGIDPSQALRDLETAILRQDPALDAPPARGR